MKKDKKPMSKQEYILFTAIAIGAIVPAFALLFAAGAVQDSGGSDKVAGALGISFFVILIADLIFMIANFKKAASYEYVAKAEKIEKDGCTVIENATQQKLLGALEAEKFTLKDGEYYHKRKISFTKDVINYFVKCASFEDFGKTLDSEFQKFESRGYKNKNQCLILFLYSDEVSENDLKKLAEVCAQLISIEETVPSSYFNTVVAVLADRISRKVYFVPTGKMSISVYAHGVKMIKKLFAGE